MSDPVYLFSDWDRQPTAAEQLARLRLHREEILPLMQGGKERDGRMFFPPKELWDTVNSEISRLEALVSTIGGVGINPIPFARVSLMNGRRLA